MTDRKPPTAKHARELEEKAREQRHADRKLRLAERVAAGAAGAPVEVDTPVAKAPDLPFLDEV
ncbi:MAG: hypothetical protein JNK64_05265 [Myxococcales bacterium]|nr:hypothetical protein [Myxococcales bacterium]